MSNDDPPKDAKAELEDQLIRQAAAPWEKILADDEREGMRIFLNLFVKTHPEMQKMVNRRVAEDAAAKRADAKRDATKRGDERTEPQALKDALRQATDRVVEASGVVSRAPEDEGAAEDEGAVKDKARRSR